MFENVPQELKDTPNWLLWKEEPNGTSKPRKVPYSVQGHRASTTNPDDWSTFDEVKRSAIEGRAGVGFVFDGGDFCGVDLDDCVGDDGELASWAGEIIEDADTYTELSPSGRGFKLFCKTNQQFRPFNIKLEEGGGVEAYCNGRFFTVTGQGDAKPIKPIPQRVLNYTSDASDRPDKPPHFEECRERVLDLPPSVSGEGGHNALFKAACTIARYAILGEFAFEILSEYNDKLCHPPWREKELRRKIREAETRCALEGEIGVCTSGPDEFDVIDDTVPSVEELTAEDDFTISTAELYASDHRVDYYIDGALAADQFMVVAAPEKCCKTSIMVDMAISLASNTPFLSHFDVNGPRRVMMLSGESGLATLKDTAMRVCESRGISMLAAADIRWGVEMLQVTNKGQRRRLAGGLKRHRPEVLMIDPAYLALTTNDPYSLIQMGQILGVLVKMCAEYGTTVVVAHHVRKSGRQNDHPPTLADMTGAGFAEFARQWLLMCQAQEFNKGVHDLWATFGGSAGHHSKWRLAIDEGEDDDLVGRKWDVSLHEPDDVHVGDVEQAVLDALAITRRPLTRAEVEEEIGFGKKERKFLGSTMLKMSQRGLIQQLDEGRFAACESSTETS